MFLIILSDFCFEENIYSSFSVIQKDSSQSFSEGMACYVL